MPVVVTGAHTALGRAVVDALVTRTGGEVRATVRPSAEGVPAERPRLVKELIARGVPTAVTDLSDPQRLGAVLEGAHTVVHLDNPLETWDLLLDAAEDTGVRRLVTVCPPDAEIPPTAGYDLVIVRTTTMAPVPALVEALVEADRRRAVGGTEITHLE